MGILKSKDRCTICGSSITFPYRLDRYGVPGFVCGRCYDERLREVYGIDLNAHARDARSVGIGAKEDKAAAEAGHK